MSDSSSRGPSCAVEDPAALLLLEDQQERWRRGERLLVEAYLARLPHLLESSEAVLELILHEVLLRRERGEAPALAEYQQRFPHLAEPLQVQFEVEGAIEGSSLTPATRMGRQPGAWPLSPSLVAGNGTGTPSLAARQILVLDRPPAKGDRISEVDPPGDLAAPFSTSADIPMRAEDPLARPSSGRRIPGYEILGELGRGGMGVVYKARHLRLNRVVALKMVLSGGHATAEECRRFLTEAEVIAAVKHPGIVQVFDFGTHDGLPFLSLELCPGGSLAGKLAGHPLPPRETAPLVEQIARAVQAAHHAGIVHRDLKPGNILLDERRQPRVTDFGLAKRTEISDGLTQTGAVVGTPSYLAPEQAQGKKDVGRTADVYSLGAILYECLTGRPPFRAATTYDTLLQVVHDEPVPPRQLCSAVPLDLETICLKCLSKEPARRYASAAELADDLRRWQAGEPIAARPAGLRERAVKWAGRRPAAAALLGVSVVAALALVGLSTLAVVQWQRAVTALTSEKQARQELQSEQTRRALAQVSALRDAAAAAVPGILADLTASRPDVLPELRQLWRHKRDPGRRLRVGLALLPVEPEAVRDELVALMLTVGDPAEVLLVRAALRGQRGALSTRLWGVLGDAGENAERRFRAACALADFDTAGVRRCREVAPFVAGRLLAAVQSNPSHYTPLLDLLRPVRAELLAPLAHAFRSNKRSESERSWATTVLADYAADRPDVLADLLMDADEKQFSVLFPKVAGLRAAALPLLAETVQTPLDAQKTEQEKESLARRQANAAAALLRLGQAARAWPLLRHSPDPRARSYLIHRLAPLGADPAALVGRLEVEKDVSIRRALVLALGEYSSEHLIASLRQRVVRRLLGWYRHDPDAGLHGTIDWLLRHGKEGKDDRPLDWAQAKALQEIDAELAARLRAERGTAWTVRQTPPGGGWHVNGQGQTFTILDAREPFLMGSPPDEAGRTPYETLHWRRIGRRFALAARPVTVAQFQRFLAANPEVKHGFVKQYSPDPDGPVIVVTWHQAAQYCRWLSEQEGFAEHDMVYPSVAEIEKHADGASPLRLPADHLKRRGYRLPTEAEWELACRAGARTSRYYGSAADLLPRYAWYLANAEDRAWPVGQKKPNDLGLFDMHGNVWTWCQESTRGYPEGTASRPAEDSEDTNEVTDSLFRVLRGGSFSIYCPLVRASYRSLYRPSNRSVSVGVRVARTCD
jgi:formylglycine-generating enzyme required for sulfatase activity/tRNA A-37 threonylcarbamoyl transferase component Bud32